MVQWCDVFLVFLCFLCLMSSNVREGEEVRIPGGGGGYPRLDRVVPKGRSHCEARAHVYYVREGEEVRLPGGEEATPG